MTLTREEAIALNEANRDIIENERPFGLMTEDQQERLLVWKYGTEAFGENGWYYQKMHGIFGKNTYRAKPAPVPAERVVRWVSMHADFGIGLNSAQSALGFEKYDDYDATFRIEYNPDGTDPQIFVEDGE